MCRARDVPIAGGTMDTDLFLTIGIVLGVLTLPALLSGWTEGRISRVGALMMLAACGLIVVALTQRPGGYAFGDIPGVMMAVVGRYVN
jgi:hypothetical protein